MSDVTLGGPRECCGASQVEHVGLTCEQVREKRSESLRRLVSGKLVPADNSHTKLMPNGQQADYVVLSPEERAKGYVKPLRHSYIHAYPSEENRRVGCGAETRMSTAIAETYARDPTFYNGTFCVRCGAHFPLNQFIWDGGGELHGEPMDPTLQELWLEDIRAKRAWDAACKRTLRIAELERELAALKAEQP